MRLRARIRDVAILAITALLIGCNRRDSKHENERKMAEDRVLAGGGWQVLRRECESLLTNAALQSYRDNGTFWHPRPDELSTSLAQLQPRLIRFETTNHPAMVQLQIFGSGKTDWTPYYGLWVVCGARPTNFVPGVSQEGDHPYSIKRLYDGVFEVYQK